MGLLFDLFRVFQKQSAQPTLQTKSSRSSLNDVFNYEQGFRTNLTYDINNSKQAVDAFNLISYVGFCVSLRANSVAKTDFNILDANDKEVTGTKIEALLRAPAGAVKRYQFIKSIVSHLLLDGNAFIWKATDNAFGMVNGLPTALVPLNPANVNVYDTQGIIARATASRVGYKAAEYRCFYQANEMILNPAELIHINAGSPINNLRGMGIVQQNSSLLEADKIQDMFNKAFFERGALANILVSQKDDNILPRDYKQMADDFKLQYGRLKDPIMFAPPGSDVTELNLNYEQLQFIDLRRLSRDNVLMMFRIPRSMAGMENQYVAKDEDKIAWEEVLEDDYVLIEEALTDFIREYENNQNIKYVFKRKNTIAQKTKAEVGAFLFDRGALSPQKYNAMVTGDTDATLSDEQYMPFNLMPVSAIGQEPEPLLNEEKKHVCNHENKGMSNRARKLHQASISIRTKTEDQIFKIVKEYFKGLEDRITKPFEKGVKDAAIDAWIESIEAEELGKNAKRFFTSAVSISIKELNEILDTNVNPEFSRIKLTVEKLGKLYVSRTLNNRKEDVRTIIQTAMNAGGGPDKIKQGIQEVFRNDFTGPDAWKSRRIARTEAMNAYNGAAKECYTELGVITCDVVGCIDDIIMDGEQYGCNSTNIPVDEIDGINFHPNHAGTIIPSGF